MALTPTQWGVSGDVPVPADYDGDGITDFAIWRPVDATNGNKAAFWVKMSHFGTDIVAFGTNGDVPIPADFNGNGRAAFATWTPSGPFGNGAFQWITNVADDGTIQTASEGWGFPGDTPVPRNYGIGKAEVVVYDGSVPGYLNGDPSQYPWSVLRIGDVGSDVPVQTPFWFGF